MVVKLEYIWLDATGNFRSKVRVVKKFALDRWNYDGSSTGQRETDRSEVTLIPVKVVVSPFASDGIDEYLVLCETEHRSSCLKLAEHVSDPMFGLEQEFFLMSSQTNLPVGHSDLPQGPFYCGVGKYANGRDFLDLAVNNCIRAGLDVTGYNLEVAPGQLEVQLCATGVDAADQFYLMRYILEGTAESMDYWINYHPKPFPSRNGSGCHINFSTSEMRKATTNEEFNHVVQPILQRLRQNHVSDLNDYGSDNRLRLSGTHETSDYLVFTSGIADRTASIRLPEDPVGENRKYFEDRRPAANIDPYRAISVLLRAAMPNTTTSPTFFEHWGC